MIMIESESQRNYKDSKLLCYGTVVYRAGQDRTQRAKAGQGRKGQPGLRRYLGEPGNGAWNTDGGEEECSRV
jgi:hypothetical protein